MTAERGLVYALGRVRQNTTGEVGDWAMTNRLLFEHGWTEHTYQRLATLGEHALKVGSWVSQMDNVHRNRGLTAIQSAVLRVTEAAEQACVSGASRDEAVGWVEVLAAVPGLTPGVLLELWIATWDFEVRVWQQAAGALAPLAYAAQIERGEARELRRRGVLDEMGLRVLIGLRRPDWKFPSTEVAPR